MVRRIAMALSATALVIACSSGSSREPSPDSGAGGTASGGMGGASGCTLDSECAPGYKCCYPCGIPDCANACVTPLANGQCPMYP